VLTLQGPNRLDDTALVRDDRQAFAILPATETGLLYLLTGPMRFSDASISEMKSLYIADKIGP